MKRPGDDPLPGSLAAGDDHVIAALFDQFGQRLYRAAMGVLGRREDAEDVVQEVFAAVLQARPHFCAPEELTAYMFTALRHAAGRCAAHRARAPMPSEAEVNAAEAVSERTDGRSIAYDERLQRALLALPASQREVLALKIDGGLTFAEIAQVLNVSANTAASRYRYALEKLRARLKESR